MPDTLSEMFAFAQQQEIAGPFFAPICRNLPDDPEVQAVRAPRLYQISEDKLATLP